MIRRPPRSTLFPYTTALPILGGDFELDSLSQRQLAAPVDRVGLAAHVGLPGVRAGLTAPARILLAAEGAADFRAGRADIDVGDAAIAARPREKQLRVSQTIGEQGGGQAVGGSVLLGDGLRERVHRDHI